MITIKRGFRVTGVSALAERLGVNKGHLSRVIHGKRKSKRLEDELAALGIKCVQPRKRGAK